MNELRARDPNVEKEPAASQKAKKAYKVSECRKDQRLRLSVNASWISHVHKSWWESKKCTWEKNILLQKYEENMF